MKQPNVTKNSVGIGSYRTRLVPWTDESQQIQKEELLEPHYHQELTCVGIVPQRVDLGPWLDQLGAGRVEVDLQLQGQVVPGGHQTPQLRRHVHKMRLRNLGTTHLRNASLHFALGLDQQRHHLLCIAVAETETSTSRRGAYSC